jgi:hypothetical protein
MRSSAQTPVLLKKKKKKAKGNGDEPVMKPNRQGESVLHLRCPSNPTAGKHAEEVPLSYAK